MIERLNFYDIYGYLLPGAALMSVMYLPYLMTGADRPSLELSSAVLSLIIAYILGHLLQILIRPVFTELPYPSDTLITAGGFPENFRNELQTLVRNDFNLNVMDDSERPVAFESCRYAVQSKDTPTYAEQHQGMYALLRGLAAVALLAAANDLGWVTARCAQTHPLVASAALWGTMSSLAGWAVMQRAWLWLGAAATAWVGWHNAGQRIDAIDIRMFILCGVTFVVAAMLFRASFRRFQYLFAKAVYVTYFARRRSMLASAPKGPSGGD